MRAYVMDGPGRGGVRDVPDPDVGDHDVAVEMLTCGVCSSTDKMLRLGTFRAEVTYPSVLGHESVGRVVEIGDRVRNFAVGDLVTRPAAYREDKAPLPMYWGGFAQRGVVTDWAAAEADGEVGDRQPRHDQVRLPPGTDPAQASLSISLSETFSVIVRHDVLSLNVGVVGTGIAGLSLIAYAKLLGAATVLAVGRRPTRLGLATEMGADVVALADEAADAVEGLGGLDIVFEASGRAEMSVAAMSWLRPGGACVVYSAPEEPASIDLFAGPRDATLSVASTHEAAVLPGILRLLETGALQVDSFLTHRFPLSEIERAFGTIAEGDVVKAVIDIG